MRLVNPLEEPLLSVREVAHALSVAPYTVYALCDRGELPHVRVSSAIRVRPVDLQAFVRSRK
jgi:excisionase family DNA binding protein